MIINVSIDDVSPHPASSVRVLDRCFDLLAKFPNMKFSLFVPTAYWRTIKHATSQELNIADFPEFCDILRELPIENFELCYHGHFHGIPVGFSDNDEFQDLTYDKAKYKFDQMIRIVTYCGLGMQFKPIFRPPAWRMSPESFRAAKDCGFQILALSPKDYAKKVYSGEDEKFEKVVYYNCNPPFDELKEANTVEVVYHACEWDNNYLSKEKSDQLSEWLDKISKVEFGFIEDLCKK